MSLLASEGIEPLFRLKKSVLNLERPKALLVKKPLNVPVGPALVAVEATA